MNDADDDYDNYDSDADGDGMERRGGRTRGGSSRASRDVRVFDPAGSAFKSLKARL